MMSEAGIPHAEIEIRPGQFLDLGERLECLSRLVKHHECLVEDQFEVLVLDVSSLVASGLSSEYILESLVVCGMSRATEQEAGSYGSEESPE